MPESLNIVIPVGATVVLELRDGSELEVAGPDVFSPSSDVMRVRVVG